MWTSFPLSFRQRRRRKRTVTWISHPIMPPSHHWSSIQSHLFPSIPVRKKCMGTASWGAHLGTIRTTCTAAGLWFIKEGLGLSFSWPVPPAPCIPTATSCKPNRRIYGQPNVITARYQPKLVVSIQKSTVELGSQNTSYSQDLKHMLMWGSASDDDLSIEELVTAPFLKLTGLEQGWQCTDLPGLCLYKGGTVILPCLKHTSWWP